MLLLSCSLCCFCEIYHTPPVSMDTASIIKAANFVLVPDECDPELAVAFFSRVAVADVIEEDKDEEEEEDLEPSGPMR